jgi:hypothetical protein
MTKLTSSSIAYTEPGTDLLTAYSFDGTDWTPLGNAFAIGAYSVVPTLCSLNETDVLFYESTGDWIRTYRYTSPNWEQVGTAATITSFGSNAGNAAICRISSTDFAYIDSSLDTLRYFRMGYVTI